jgi:hypothetical protein
MSRIVAARQARSARTAIAAATTVGALAVAWFAGAAPVWQGMSLHR